MALTVRDIVVDIYRDEMVPYLDSMTTREVENYLCLPITGCYNTMMCNFRDQFLTSAAHFCGTHRSGTLSHRSDDLPHPNADLLSESRPMVLASEPSAAYFATIGDFDSVCQVLSKGYDDACLDKVIAYAAANGHLDIVKHVVALGVGSQGIDAALYRAVTREHLAVVKFLISSQSHTYAFQEWLGYLAAETGNIEIVDFLIEQGAEDIDGMIMHACEHKRYETVDFLIKKGRSNPYIGVDLEWLIDKLRAIPGRGEDAKFLQLYLRKSCGSQENKQN